MQNASMSLDQQSYFFLTNARTMKGVFDFLHIDHKHMQHALCHPRREASFDNDAIQKKIDEIREKKQQLRVQAERKRQQIKAKQLRYEQFPLQKLLQQSLQDLDESSSMRIKQKMKFIQQKVYIGTKNNVNSEYISKVVDSNQAKPALKYQLSLFMEDIMSNLETDIVAGSYDIFNRKDLIIPKHQQSLLVYNPPSTSKLIQIKKNQLSNKIQELKDQLGKTQLQHQKLSPLSKKPKSFSVRATSATGSMIASSLNLEDFSIKSERTKQAENFVKNLQKQQQQQRKQRLRRQQELRKMQVKSQQQKKQFQQHLKKQRHEKLKKKYENERQQKKDQFQKANKVKSQFQKFLSQYRKRVPLYKQKQMKFSVEKQKQEKQKMMSILSEIKQAKRSIDINQLKEHENKYKVIRQQFQKQKLANLKHRQKQIYLRHKQDKLYFRGRYHSMIKDETEKQPQDPMVKKEQLLKKQKQYGQKVKKQFVPQVDQKKQKQLQQLIAKINKNKPNNVETKDYNQLGNKYLSDLHALIKDIKSKGQVKVQLPQQIKPRYRNYLQDLKKSRTYRTISYDNMTPDDLQKQAFRFQQNAKKKQKLLALTEQIDIEKQLKQIDELDMQLLKSAQLKAKLVSKYQSIDDNGDIMSEKYSTKY